MATGEQSVQKAAKILGTTYDGLTRVEERKS